MKNVIIGICGVVSLVAGLIAVIVKKSINSTSVFMDDSFRWGNGRGW